MRVGVVFRDVLPLPTNAPLGEFSLRRAAHDAAVVEPSPDLVKVFAHRIVSAGLPIVLLQIDDAKVTPGRSCVALSTNDLQGVVVRIPLDNYAALTAVAGAAL